MPRFSFRTALRPSGIAWQAGESEQSTRNRLEYIRNPSCVFPSIFLSLHVVALWRNFKYLPKGIFLIPPTFVARLPSSLSSRGPRRKLHHVRFGDVRRPIQQQQVLQLLEAQCVPCVGRYRRQPQAQLLPGKRRSLLWQQNCRDWRRSKLIAMN